MTHLRHMQFLAALDDVPSPELMEKIREHSQEYLSAAVQRNRCEEFTGVEKEERIITTNMSSADDKAYKSILRQARGYEGDDYSIEAGAVDADIFGGLGRGLALVENVFHIAGAGRASIITLDHVTHNSDGPR